MEKGKFISQKSSDYVFLDFNFGYFVIIGILTLIGIYFYLKRKKKMKNA